MAPPTAALRLSQIDPAALACEVEDAIVRRLQRLSWALAPGVEVRVVDTRSKDGARWSHTQIGESVRTLAGYALGRHGLDSSVHEYMISLLDVLGRVLGDASTADELDELLSDRGDVSELRGDAVADQIALVVVAALGREALAEELPLLPSQVAALGECSTDHVRLLARRGELERAPGDEVRITAESAKRWLEGRQKG